jgi:solute carrier family 25 (adenine nucleotide translocator) protein 4/5/6/31
MFTTSTLLQAPKPFAAAAPSPILATGPKKGGNFWRDMAIGGSIGAVSKTIMSPVERVKILMQTMDSNPKVISGEVEPYKGIGDCFARVKAEQGVGAFWRGNTVNCLRYAPQQGSALAFNDFFKNLFPKYDKNTEFMKYFGANLMAGGSGGATAMVICYPLDFARTRLASDLTAGKPQFAGITDCIMQTIKAQGVMGLYRGTAVSVAGAFVYRAGQLGLYGTVMGFNPYKEDKGLKGFFSAVVIGTAARTVVLPFNYPFDTVRRRLMLESEKPAAERTYKSGVDCFFKVLKAEGTAGMYKGLGSEVFRGFGGVMVIVLYDRIKNYLGMNEEQ